MALFLMFKVSFVFGYGGLVVERLVEAHGIPYRR